MDDSFFVSLARNRIPISTQIEITRNCNWKCDFCYLGNGHTGEMDYTLLSQLIRDLKDMGGLKLCFTGGEPFARHDAIDIFHFAKNLGFVCEVNTNGSLIHRFGYDEVANIFASINISLHSNDAKIHDKLVGIDGAWAMTVDAILKLKECSANVTINSVITKEVVATYDKLREFVMKDLGCTWQPDTRISGTYSGSDVAVRKYQVDRDDLCEILRRDADLTYYTNGDVFCTGVCKAARNTCFIDVEGNVFPCLQFKKDVAAYPALLSEVQSIRDLTFQQIWETNPLLLKASAITEKDFQMCISCAHYKECFKCIAQNYFATGDMAVPSIDICDEERFYASFNS